jgi:hypothetical protein
MLNKVRKLLSQISFIWPVMLSVRDAISLYSWLRVRLVVYWS